MGERHAPQYGEHGYVSPLIAADRGRVAAKQQRPLEENPFTANPDDYDKRFNPDAASAWEDGWTAETRRKFAEALKGAHA